MGFSIIKDQQKSPAQHKIYAGDYGTQGLSTSVSPLIQLYNEVPVVAMQPIVPMIIIAQFDHFSYVVCSSCGTIGQETHNTKLKHQNEEEVEVEKVYTVP